MARGVHPTSAHPMNHALGPTSLRALTAANDTWSDETGRLRRLQSLLALLSLYAAALLAVIALSDGADIGCILGGIAGHVLYATHRMAALWRDDAWMDEARARLAARVYAR
jgi:hypothetical protein